jgi:hypothetical protein
MSENEISDAFDSMSNSIFDNIIFDPDDYFTSKDLWDDELAMQENYCNMNSFTTMDESEAVMDAIEANTTPLPPEMLNHDCMWSGTCTDRDHKIKKRHRFSHIDEIIIEDSDSEGMALKKSLDPNLTIIFSETMDESSVEEKPEVEEIGPLVHPCERVSKIMAEWAEAFNCYPHVQSDPDPLPPSPESCCFSEIELPTSMPAVPPPLQFFAPIQSFIKIEQQQQSNPPPVIQYHQPQMFFNPFVANDMDTVKHEMPAQLSVNFLSANEIVKTENVGNQFNENEQEIEEQYLIKNQETFQITPFYPQIKLQATQSSSPLLFYNNSLFTLEQLNNTNFVDLQRLNSPQPPPPPQPPFLAPRSNAVVPKVKRTKPKKKLGTIRKTKKPKLTKKAKKEILMTFPFHDPNGQQIFEINGEPVLKKNMHNCMERQRRIGLKNLFVQLKQAIPELDEYERVPKVSILRKAASYCQELKEEDKELLELRKYNARLIKKFNQLTHSIPFAVNATEN